MSRQGDNTRPAPPGFTANLAAWLPRRKMPGMGLVTSLFARKVVAAAEGKVDSAAMLAGVGIAPDDPWDTGKMIPADSYYDMLERIADQIDVTDLPLRTGASMRLDEYGALGLAFKAATTLGASHARVERYARLWTSVVEYELRPATGGTLFILHRAGERRLGMRLSNEATLASAVSIAKAGLPRASSARGSADPAPRAAFGRRARRLVRVPGALRRRT